MVECKLWMIYIGDRGGVRQVDQLAMEIATTSIQKWSKIRPKQKLRIKNREKKGRKSKNKQGK